MYRSPANMQLPSSQAISIINTCLLRARGEGPRMVVVVDRPENNNRCVIPSGGCGGGGGGADNSFEFVTSLV